LALLHEIATRRTLLLQPEHMVGRAPVCALRLAPRYVSAQHALLRWARVHWELKDLGSRNGTFLDGVRVDPRRTHPIVKGARLAFGNVDDTWELSDDSAPCAMAVPLDGGEPSLIEGDLHALPSSEDPRITIYRDLTGCWVIEQMDESTSIIQNQQLFEIAGRWWRFCCVEDALTTGFAWSSQEMVVRDIELAFLVSRDEEHVELRLSCRGRTFDLGARARNYFLLTLARRRLADVQAGEPETSCGWLSLDESAHDPMMAPLQVNLDVHRIRQQLAKVGVVDPVNIIERRPMARQLRIGTSRLTIDTM
jgi:FHA domain